MFDGAVNSKENNLMDVHLSCLDKTVPFLREVKGATSQFLCFNLYFIKK